MNRLQLLEKTPDGKIVLKYICRPGISMTTFWQSLQSAFPNATVKELRGMLQAQRLHRGLTCTRGLWYHAIKSDWHKKIYNVVPKLPGTVTLTDLYAEFKNEREVDIRNALLDLEREGLVTHVSFARWAKPKKWQPRSKFKKTRKKD